MASTMTYKGYTAKIDYEAEKDLFVGRILGMKDDVDFEGASVEELKDRFHTVLDAYLKECEQCGKEPGKPYSGKLALRLPGKMHKALHMRSETAGVSINELILNAINAYLIGEPGKAMPADLLQDLPFSYGAMQLEDMPSGR